MRAMKLLVLFLLLSSRVVAMENVMLPQARKLALEAAEKLYHHNFGDLVVEDNGVVAKADGWIIIPVSKKYAETHDDLFMILGGVAFYVKKNGAILQIPASVISGGTIDEYINEHSE